MNTFLLIAHHENEKTWRIALNWTAHIEEIEELEEKKFSFEDMLVFLREKIESAHLQRTTQAVVFGLDLQVLLLLQR